MNRTIKCSCSADVPENLAIGTRVMDLDVVNQIGNKPFECSISGGNVDRKLLGILWLHICFYRQTE